MKKSEFKEIMGIMDEIEETVTKAVEEMEEDMNTEAITIEPYCPTWINFLNEVTGGNAEAINQLQEFAGTCLAPERVWGKALVLKGVGVGKSTFARILRKMVGSENTSSVSMVDVENMFYRANLKDKWLNISVLENPQDLECAYFKVVVTGDPVSASFKYKDPFEFSPSCKLVLHTNIPQCDNRRCISVDFLFHPSAINPNLGHELENEIYGIRYWAAKGLERLNSQGHFTECSSQGHVCPEIEV